ncbi:hypothetical protein GOBAR_AA26659 [Gossypium barbadense]|uniref:lipoyl(octanoyl) transferase n=1 Tax=Gossypium barbadense TaxID=3634 RepID=A0A2P5WSG6_GOSBA|nr:hypothetical protein GOBAR_AA26659 [Gossypium barbadense]
MRGPGKLEVWKMGFVNYLDALKLQEKLVSDRKLCRIPDTLLSLQHPPTYTLGKRRTDHNLLLPVSELKNIGAELHYTQRGGDITFHGPHQAILYPIISLREIGIGARNYVEKLESTMIELSSLYGVKACAGQKGETGVWIGERKIGAIGVRISYGITSHGLAYNIDPDLKYFKHIVPCGITDKEVTSLRRETATVLPAEEKIFAKLNDVYVLRCPPIQGETGVWVGERKIGAIGVRISYGITSHGLAYNIDPDLKYFKHIVPCGITDKEVTSLRRETATVLPAEEVIQEQLISCFARLFGYSTVTWKENPSMFSDHESID